MNLGEGETTCFWLEPLGTVRLSLRRFTFAVAPGDVEHADHRDCPESTSGHDATVWLDDVLPLKFDDHDDGYRTMAGVPVKKRPLHTDRRWPQLCDACGQPFRRGDQWQVNQAEQYRRSDTGETVEMRHHPGRDLAGALYDAWWLHNYTRVVNGESRGFVGPDGIALVAVCPNGFPWEVDGPATGGGGWTRTGDPRQPETLTVSPSIVAGRPGEPSTYHGFLRGGVFTPHIG